MPVPDYPFPGMTYESSVRYTTKIPTAAPLQNESRFVWFNGLYVWADNKWNYMPNVSAPGLTVDLKVAIIGQGQKTLHFVNGILTSMT